MAKVPIILISLLFVFLVARFLINRDTATFVNPLKNTPTEENPFGVMLGGKNVESASKLGVAYYRPTSIFIDKWDGTCGECDEALAQGLKLILTVRNNGGREQSTTPPQDLALYKKVLGEVLDKYQLEVLVIENEENSAALFYSGTPEEYHSELKAACEVAHAKRIKCTNGGFVSSLVALLVADNYRGGEIPKRQKII